MLFLLFFSMPAKTFPLYIGTDGHEWVHLTDSDNNDHKLYVSFKSLKSFLPPKSETEDSEPPTVGFEVTTRLNFTISIYWQGGTIPKHLDWHRKEEKEHLKGKQNVYFYLLYIFKLYLYILDIISHD